MGDVWGWGAGGVVAPLLFLLLVMSDIREVVGRWGAYIDKLR